MGTQGFYRGTTHDQVPFFANKDVRFLKSTKWPADYNKTDLDFSKINLTVIFDWVTERVTELLGADDDIVIEYAKQQIAAGVRASLGDNALAATSKTSEPGSQDLPGKQPSETTAADKSGEQSKEDLRDRNLTLLSATLGASDGTTAATPSSFSPQAPQTQTTTPDDDFSRLCPKRLQISLTGFLGRKAAVFVRELWTFLLEAEKSPHGIPPALMKSRELALDAKQEEARRVEDKLRNIERQQQAASEKDGVEKQRGRSFERSLSRESSPSSRGHSRRSQSRRVPDRDRSQSWRPRMPSRSLSFGRSSSPERYRDARDDIDDREGPDCRDARRRFRSRSRGRPRRSRHSRSGSRFRDSPARRHRYSSSSSFASEDHPVRSRRFSGRNLKSAISRSPSFDRSFHGDRRGRPYYSPRRRYRRGPVRGYEFRRPYYRDRPQWRHYNSQSPRYNRRTSPDYGHRQSPKRARRTSSSPRRPSPSPPARRSMKRDSDKFERKCYMDREEVHPKRYK